VSGEASTSAVLPFTVKWIGMISFRAGRNCKSIV
jgi:hypothetical protein